MPRPEPRALPRHRKDIAAPARRGTTAANARHEALEWLKSLAVAVLVFLVLRIFLVQTYSIPSGSMENTLLIGDYLVATNVVFGPHIPFTGARLPGLRDPRRGDIVVFRPTYNRPEMDVVKRVIGTPGDTLRMLNQQLYRNGKKVAEPYAVYDGSPDQPIGRDAGSGMGLPPEVIPERYGYQNHLPALAPGVDPATYQPTRDTWGPLVVPPGKYFLMGDNRNQSLDSRFMGFIPRDQIRGEPLFLYFSYDPQRDAPFPRFLTAARWGRIGRPVR